MFTLVNSSTIMQAIEDDAWTLSVRATCKEFDLAAYEVVYPVKFSDHYVVHENMLPLIEHATGYRGTYDMTFDEALRTLLEGIDGAHPDTFRVMKDEVMDPVKGAVDAIGDWLSNGV